MITIYSEKKEVRNNALPPQKRGGKGTKTVISGSLEEMRKLVKKNLNVVKRIDWKIE